MSSALLIATQNRNKVAEIRRQMEKSKVNLELLTPGQLGIEDAPEETSDSFEGNALLKARYYANLSGKWVLAEDSGLCVDALAGAPGVLSARYGDVSWDATTRNTYLLEQMEKIPGAKRGAQYRTVMILCNPQAEQVAQSEGILRGTLTTVPRGSGGFGYDPIFNIDEMGKTAAEITADQKNELSHRGHALRAIMPQITEAMNL